MKFPCIDLDPAEKMSVIFFVHGGGYMSGGSSWHGPEILLDEDVILVTINYRLGPFGFLSLDTAEYSGNMGLKDQLLALKWVNENIEHFGGKRLKMVSTSNKKTLFVWKWNVTTIYRYCYIFKLKTFEKHTQPFMRYIKLNVASSEKNVLNMKKSSFILNQRR